MITPEFLNKIIEGIEDKYGELNNEMTKRIAKKIVSVFSDVPKTQKELNKRLYKEPVYDEINKAIIKHTDGINKEIKKAYLDSANEISKHNTQLAHEIGDKYNITIPEYPQKTVKASEMNLTDNEIEMVEKAYKRGQRTAHNLTGTLPSAGQDAYINACNDAFNRVKAGQSMDEALTKAIDDMAQKGVAFIDYDSGRRDRVEVAIARAVRTGINQMNSDLVLERCAEMGVSYVQVSQHLGARVTKFEDYTNHALWQGKVYSVDWNNPVLAEKGFTPHIEDSKGRFGWLDKIKKVLTGTKRKEYPDFVKSTGYGEMLGLAGINCRHTFRAFVPEINQEEEPINETENRIQYEAEQKARAMERAIRDTKREIDALEYSRLDNDESRNKLSVLSNKLAQQRFVYNSHLEMYGIDKEQYKTNTVIPSIKQLGNLKPDILKVLNKPNIPNKMVTTDEWLQHMDEDKSHPLSYKNYGKYLYSVATNPDYIIKDKYDPNKFTIFLKEIKTSEETLYFRAIVKYGDKDKQIKNLVKTYFYINPKTYDRYTKNTEILYRRK